MRQIRYRAMLAVGILMSAAMPLPAAAVDMPPLAAQWYAALQTADRNAFLKLIAQDAKIDLRQLDIVQSRDEFIESLDNWEDVVRDAKIETKPISGDPANAVIDVCYRFPSNQRLIRETFVFAGAVIANQTQELIAENCDGF